MNDKLASALSLCRKAGKLVTGSESTREAVLRGDARLVLLMNNVADRTRRQTTFVCTEENVPLRECGRSMEELWQVAGRRAGVLAICDAGFAKMITGLLPEKTKE